MRNLEFTDLDREKHILVYELLVDTADDNYVAARWCYGNKLYIDFYWLAVHALEKYLKAILLLNDGSAKNFGHDIGALFLAARKIARSLLPKKLEQPPQLKRRYWHKETTAAFIKRLYANGNADNRYMLFGYSHLPEDIYKLDALIFATRRLCQRLDSYYFSAHIRNSRFNLPQKNIDITTRALLHRQPDWWEQVAGGRLTEIARGSAGKDLQHVLLNHNVAFAPKGYSHTKFYVSSASHVPVLWRHVLEPIEKECDAASKKLAYDVRDWLVASMKLPKDVERQLRSAKQPKKTKR